MKPTELTEALRLLVRAKRPAMVHSHPGMGKSQIMRAVARLEGRKLFDLRLTGRDASDVLGLPTIARGETTWARPAMLPKESDGPSLLFLDELNRASQMMLNAGLQMILDHKIGEHALPANCVVMAAGNPESDPGVVKMSAAMKLRLVHLDLEVSVEDWSQWAIGAGIEPVVIAFIRFRPELLHRFDAKERSSPNPRTWEFVSRIVSENPDPRIAHALFAGAIGESAAGEFAGFRRLYATLPSIDAIMLNPAQTKVPSEPSTLYAIAAALARRATPQNFGRILTYLDRLPVEYHVLSVKMAAGRHNGTLTSTPEFTKWAVAHSDVTF